MVHSGGSDIRHTKDAVRAELTRALGALGTSARADRSRRLCEALLACDLYRNADVVLAFSPIGTEPDLGPILEQTLRSGRGLCLARLDWGTRAMEPARVTSLDDLVVRRHQVPEPPEDAPRVGIGELDLVLVPGLGFDRRGGRLGRGSGYYDRFLALPGRRAPAAGVAFETQILDHIPTDGHDVPMDALVTDQGVILCVGGTGDVERSNRPDPQTE